MYVCVCNAIRETELRRAALACSGNVEAVYHSLDCQPQCRQCFCEAEAIIDDERHAQNLPVVIYQ